MRIHCNIHQCHHSFCHLEKACNHSGNCIWLGVRQIGIRGHSHHSYVRNNSGSNVFGVCRFFRPALSRGPRCRSGTRRNPWCSGNAACIPRCPLRIRQCRYKIFRFPHSCTLGRKYSGSLLGYSRIYSGRCAFLFRIHRHHDIAFHSECSHDSSYKTCRGGRSNKSGHIHRNPSRKDCPVAQGRDPMGPPDQKHPGSVAFLDPRSHFRRTFCAVGTTCSHLHKRRLLGRAATLKQSCILC